MTEINAATKLDIPIKRDMTSLKEHLFLAVKCCFTYKMNGYSDQFTATSNYSAAH